jgi:peptide chain release factor 2/peptide chain release factor
MTRSFVLQVSAGVGPPPARRFAAKLAAHLEALAMERGLVVREIVQRGDDAEPRSIAIVLAGDAPLLVADQLGTHALVARAAERGKASRKRWFVGVSLHPLEDEARGTVAIDPRDLEVTATTAPGPGGQHVNKTATAVRVHHRPSGITVRVADERSQRTNLKRAIERISREIARANAARQAEGTASRRLAHWRVERGRAVHTYVEGARGALVE